MAHDLPDSVADFDRWVIDRVLSPAAALHHEATTLMAEDPALTNARSLHHHSILAAIGAGEQTSARVSKRVGKPASVLNAALDRLVAAEFIAKHDDAIRGQTSPVYRLGDPYLQFHYALLAPHRAALRDRSHHELWHDRLRATFDSQVRGPVFEEQARMFLRRHADADTLGGPATHFTADLCTTAMSRPDVHLIDLDRLYNGR